jgi:hypothetical protein
VPLRFGGSSAARYEEVAGVRIPQLKLRALAGRAPALAADEVSAARAAEVRAVYGERFRYQDIDRALDGVRSGLLCVPTLELRTGA